MVSEDKRTITVTLSYPVEKGYVQYERWGSGPGFDYSSFQRRADNQLTVTVHTHFDRSGTSGKQTITLRPCIELEETADDSVSCGPAYPLSIDLGVPDAFSDVPSNHPQSAAIQYVLSQGLVSGYSDGTYKPDTAINRAEFTKIVTLFTFGQQMIDMCNTGLRVTDVPRNAWYRKYICRAQDSHLIKGYPDKTFRPAQSINFAEAAKIIVLADVIGDPEQSLRSESDPWYERYIDYLSERNAIPESVHGWSKNITRGEMAEVIYRLRSEDGQRADVFDGGPPLSLDVEEHVSSWQQYDYPDFGFSIAFPKSFTVESEGVEPHFPRGRYWFRVDAKAPQLTENPAIVFEVNADESEPLPFDREVKIVEDSTGGVRNYSGGATVAHHDGHTIVSVPSITGRNGNTYSMRWSMDIDEEDYDAYGIFLYKIFSTIRLHGPALEPSMYQSPQGRFSLQLPEWATERGNDSFNLPMTAPGTNLTEKYLTIIEGGNHISCRNPPYHILHTEDVFINGIPYRREVGVDHGMSQTYTSVRYTTLYPNYTGSICTSLTFTLRSSNPDVYEYPPVEFDEERESEVFDTIMRSVWFE